MKIEQLRSGSYRIREQRDGHRVSIVVDKKPTQNEARELLEQQFKLKPVKREYRTLTFEQAYEAYMEAKSNLLSPSTIRGYKNMFRNLPEDFKRMRIFDISNIDVQKIVNDYAADHSPKSVANLYGLITTVLKMFDIINIHATLPQKKKMDVYIPTKDEAKRFFEAAKGSRYEACFLLASMGLRRSEIRALTLDDLKGNELTINKALVLGDNGDALKGTKTTDSTRTLVLPPYLVELINRQGYIYRGSQSGLTDELRRIQDKAGIPHFSLHKFRHFFASYMHDEGYSDKVIQALGGWSSSSVLDRVYKHAMNQDEARQSIAADMGNLFS